MNAEAAEEWLEPLDWIEPDAVSVDAPRPEMSVERISELGLAAWTRLSARLRNATSPDSSA
jgi:hypothetical protein